MIVNDYFEKQEKQKKLFESIMDEAQKQAILNGMRDAEMVFLKDNFTQQDSHIDTKIDENSIQIQPKKSLGTFSKEGENIVSVQTQKITPENLFDHCKIRDTKGNDVSNKELDMIKNSPDLIKKICDFVNAKMCLNMKNTLGNVEGFAFFDNGKEIGFKKEGTMLDPKLEVQNIIDRAQKFKDREKEQTNEIDLKPLQNTKEVYKVQEISGSFSELDNSLQESRLKTDDEMSETTSFKL